MGFAPVLQATISQLASKVALDRVEGLIFYGVADWWERV